MRRTLLRGALSAFLLAGGLSAGLACEPACPPAPGAATAAVVGGVARGWLKREWRDYLDRFVTPEGRVVDNANGNVSHSEGQGYAMLIATYADDAAAFDKVWGWTRAHLRVRDDRLFAWRWDPAKGEVSDRNDATDGDLLIAWALARGAETFGRPALRDEARAVAASLGAKALVDTGFGLTLAPATAGFGAADQPDGPIVNPSYWVFPALSAMADLDDAHDWAAVRRDAFAMLAGSRFDDLQLPVDWESAKAEQLAPARNFAHGFGYDALRIPLYLSWSDEPTARRELARFAAAWPSGGAAPAFRGAGYTLVAELARCASGKGEIDPDSLIPRDKLYYPATLRLLVLIVVLERYPQCV